MAWSPNGKRILTGSADKTAKVWDAEKGQEIRSLKGDIDQILTVSWSPDGKRIFAWDIHDKVLAWSVADGQPIEPADPPAASPPGPARSPDGFLLAVPQGNAVAVTDTRIPPNDNTWPLPEGTQRKRYHTEQAAIAEQEKQWFAAAFHLRRVLRDDPENPGAKTRLTQAENELARAPK